MNWVESFLLSQAIRASALLLAAFLATFAMRKTSASARRFVWAVTFAGLFILPLLSVALPPIAGGIWTPPAKEMSTPISTAVTVFERIPGPAISTTMRPTRPIPWVELIWAAGILAVLARLSAGIIRLWWIRRHTSLVDASLADAGNIRCLESELVNMPMTFGVFRPAILLPSKFRDWPADRLSLVLAHERMHIQQQDCLFQILAQLACAFYWFNPLLWLAAARLRIERERACDDAVLETSIEGAKYAEHLLEMVRGNRRHGSPVLAVAMAYQSQIEHRLVALLDPRIHRKRLSRGAAMAAMVAAACLLAPLAAVRGQSSPPRGNLSGVVYDASGAVNPRATILATNLDANTRETALANEAGEYTLASVPPGHYAIDVSSPGFKMHRDYVRLKPNDHQHLDIKLDIGNVSENIEVIGKKPAAVARPAAIPHRIRVGGNVVAAKLVSKIAPVYPEYAQANGTEGAVLLEAVISTEGNILSLRVVNSADADLARAATTAVQQWHYQPTLLNGEPVEVITTITVDFQLKP